MLLLSTVWICNSLINLLVFRMALFAFVLSVRAINLLMIKRFFCSDPSIFCFNVINVSTIICGLSVVALLEPAWIITVSRSSCNKSFRFCCMFPDHHVTRPLGFFVCLLFYHQVLAVLGCDASSITYFPLCRVS